MAKLLFLLIGFLLTLTIHAQAALAVKSSAVVDPLPSWNEGAAKQAIGEFVAKVIKPDSPDFVPITERIAVFDNDGTLWSEQPMSFQFLFALDRVKALAHSVPSGRPRSHSPHCSRTT